MSPVVVPPPEITSLPPEPTIWSLTVPPVIVKFLRTVSTEFVTLNVTEPVVDAVASTVIAPVLRAVVAPGKI